MKNFIRLHDSRAVRPVLLAVSAAAAIAAVGGTAGTAAGQGTEAAHYAHKASHLLQAAFNDPKLEHGLLAIEGTKRSDRLALRLQSRRRRRFSSSTSATTARRTTASPARRSHGSPRCR